MARNTQPDRWESLILALAMALAGTWFLFDRFAYLLRSSDLLQASLHAAPLLLAGVAVSLVLASVKGEPAGREQSRKSQYE